MPVVLASLSALAWGVSDFAGGLVSRRLRAMVVVFWSQLAGLAVGLAAAPWFGGPGLTGSVVLWGAAAGLAGSFGLVSLYRGLAEGTMSVVAPVSAVVAAGIPVAAGLLAGERPQLLAWAGMALALPAIWLVSRPGDGRWGAGVGLGLAAGLGFGMFFVLLSFTEEGVGLWPLIPARIASVLLIASILAWQRTPLAILRRDAPGVAGVGVGDMTANMLFLSAVQQGLLSLVAVVSSLYPVVTVLMARLFIAETIGPRRWTGIGLALASLAMISA